MTKKFALILFLFPWLNGFSQQSAIFQKEFCTNLHEVMEDGAMENFESLPMMLQRIMPIMDTHRTTITLPQFPILYVDKDSRFVAKTALNMDSVSALKELDALKSYVSVCLDSTKWKWYTRMGDDTGTVFFREFKEYYTTDGTLSIILAMTLESGKVYSASMFIKRIGRPTRRE